MKTKLETNLETDYDVIVVGGGASGMMAAYTAALRDLRVLVIDKNKRLGEKLSITGGGRCNITNAEEDVHTFLKNYGKANKFLYSPFSQFGVKDTFDFFESHGLPLVVEARKRAFPETMSAESVRTLMEKLLKKRGVVVKLGRPVKKIMRDENGVTGVVVDGTTYIAKTYILATGGLSHAETGSSGDGFGWLSDLGHTVAEPTPSIVPLSVKDSWVHKLSGVSLSFMKITFFENARPDDPVGRGVKKFQRKGKILFTHFGLSGPLILNSAHAVADLFHAGVVTATIDMYPDTDIGTLESKIIKIFDANKNKIFKSVIKECVPEGMTEAVISNSKIDSAKKVHSITREERRAFVELLKAMPLTITGLMGYDRAVIADGGVSLSEVDMRTMRSLKCPNLAITGDLLHVNRPSGGFSLQLCWTSGYVAGMHA